MAVTTEPSAFKRLPTGVPGLDRILHGGFPTGSLFIVQGSPGAGKTVLANQICFEHAQRGEQAVYVTLLAESHDRLLKNLSTMEFYDRSQVPSNIYYVSGFDRLVSDGLSGILSLIATEAKTREASLLVLDGLFVLEESVESSREFRKFINDLSTLTGLMGCTVLLLTNSAREPSSPEYTMVDGWIELSVRCKEYRSYRTLTVHKVRGSDFISGFHLFTISKDGITVMPRFERIEGKPNESDAPLTRLSTGVADLDRMVGGGLPYASTTLMLGPTGVGKTSLGLQFISQCTPADPGLIFGFYENASQLRRRARNHGIDLDSLVKSGTVEIVWNPSTENLLDDLACELLTAVRRRKIARLFVDGIDGFAQSIIFKDRLPSFLTAMTNTLRNEGVTTLYSMELPFLIGGEHRVSLGSISAVAENIVLLRYAESASRLHRTLSVVKVRESDFDPSVREYQITERGIRIGGPLFIPASNPAGTDPIIPDGE